MLNDDFEYRISRIGLPEDGVHPTAEQLAFARGHLPSSFVDFLEQFGFGNYFDRGVQFVDPQRFRAVLALIFKADPDFNHNDCHVISYSAFGKLKVWSERHWLVTIDLLQYQIWCHKLFATEFKAPSLPSMAIRQITADSTAHSLLPREKDDRECWDFHQKPMFSQCIKQHGPLQEGECFGFVPSLGLLGFESPLRVVENVKRFQALEHSAMTAQMKPFFLTRMSSQGYEYKREIGAPQTE
ncbi:GAD-like domain-containing protein [Phyllobacterium sp. 628]|uniref:GAD-like domain-containing protein n=1 Tax=Phyllobacterium sp. 628 TaxID=2718938 RepID=UPI001AEDC006|nr:GAD-like domain-containing protein [Phyllobacterium sp. 628]